MHDNTKSILRAKEADLVLWSSNSSLRGRYDYITDRFLLTEMLNDDFFGVCFALLQVNDIITITDAEDQIMDVRVDEIDKRKLKCRISKLERRYATPVVELRDDLPDDPGLVYRYRPTRAGGHSIVTGHGELFAINFETRSDAERAIANVYDQKVFEAPAGHEPAPPFVSPNAKIFKRA